MRIRTTIAAALLLWLIAPHFAHGEEAQNPASPVAQAAAVLALKGCQPAKPPQKAHKRPKAKPKTWIVPQPCADVQPAPLPLDIVPPQVLPYYYPASPDVAPLMPPPSADYGPVSFPDYGGSAFAASPAVFTGGGFIGGAVAVTVNNAAPVYKPVPIVVNVTVPKQPAPVVNVSVAAPKVTITNTVTATVTASATASAIAISGSSSSANLTVYGTGSATKAPEISAGGIVPMLTLLIGALAVMRGRRPA